MNKICGHCKKPKSLGNFFTAPESAAVSWDGTSAFCRQCHDDGLIKHGYGWYGKDKWTSPNDNRTN